MSLRRPGVRGEMVFHPAARRTRVGPGGQRWPLWRCEKNQPQFIQRRYNRAQRHTHLPAQHIWHSGQVRCKRMICLFNPFSAERLAQTPWPSSQLCPLWFPVTAGSISAPSLPGTCRPQREPGQKLKSWHHPKSSSLSNLQVWCKRHTVTHLNIKVCDICALFCYT